METNEVKGTMQAKVEVTPKPKDRCPCGSGKVYKNCCGKAKPAEGKPADAAGEVDKLLGGTGEPAATPTTEAAKDQEPPKATEPAARAVEPALRNFAKQMLGKEWEALSTKEQEGMRKAFRLVQQAQGDSALETSRKAVGETKPDIKALLAKHPEISLGKAGTVTEKHIVIKPDATGDDILVDIIYPRGEKAGSGTGAKRDGAPTRLGLLILDGKPTGISPTKGFKAFTGESTEGFDTTKQAWESLGGTNENKRKRVGGLFSVEQVAETAEKMGTFSVSLTKAGKEYFAKNHAPANALETMAANVKN